MIGTPTDRAALSGNDVRRIVALTDTYYPMRVMDSGNQPTSSAFHGAIDVADVLVIPVLDAMSDWQGAMQLLRHLHQVGGHAADLARNAIVVRMHDNRPDDRDVIACGDQLIYLSAGSGAQQAGRIKITKFTVLENTYEYRGEERIAGKAPLTHSIEAKFELGENATSSLRKGHIVIVIGQERDANFDGDNGIVYRRIDDAQRIGPRPPLRDRRGDPTKAGHEIRDHIDSGVG